MNIRGNKLERTRISSVLSHISDYENFGNQILYYKCVFILVQYLHILQDSKCY